MGIKGGFHFSLRSILATLAICAVGAMALRAGDWFWARIWFSLVLAILLGSILGAVYGARANRVFWTGFALFGWTYMLMTTLPVLGIAEHQLLGPLIMESVKDYVPDGNSGISKEVGNYRIAIFSFSRIVHAWCAMLFGAAGGLVAIGFYSAAERQM